ncbi:MAG: Manganese transporter [Acidimicrobiales bacterium]|nr:Manganese transporter [Acidimicrobiales bacterium]
MRHNRRNVRTIVVLATAASVVLAACGSSSAGPAGAGGRPLAVATTTQVADFTRQVGGSLVDVHQVLQPNVDPHDYEPSPADLDALARASVVVENGLGLETWLPKARSSAGSKGLLVDASRGAPFIRPKDPHLWHDPRNAEHMVRAIAAGLAQADPPHAADYQRNAAAYIGKLQALDADVARQLAQLTNRKLVTNHDAFGYYVHRYGLVFVGAVIPSFDTSAELSGRALSDLVARIKAQHVKAVFSESSLPPKAAEAIAQRAGVRVLEGKGALYGDTLGPRGSDGDTYIKMMEHNARTIVGALR